MSFYETHFGNSAILHPNTRGAQTPMGAFQSSLLSDRSSSIFVPNTHKAPFYASFIQHSDFKFPVRNQVFEAQSEDLHSQILCLSKKLYTNQERLHTAEAEIDALKREIGTKNDVIEELRITINEIEHIFILMNSEKTDKICQTRSMPQKEQELDRIQSKVSFEIPLDASDSDNQDYLKNSVM
ncbi:hypothetical protein SS50377_20776 [Spironucleus salmonicida]|uniref:Uncharacterized protein n=1 Tax=Spironucleus salmonicida TaxID=348837 RepID=V6LR78_9EUKA|nr:hypothetical protein SS50377_20776 [Spironucleus salmonicida]|eukprot:EST47115.1 Hypothetical protein SS50377_12823 [Spironucleus salmonicida]